MSSNRRPHLAALLLCALSTGVAHAETVSTLAQQGLADGISILDSNSPESFYLRLPADIALKDARVQLHLDMAPGLGADSTLQVFVNGHPRTQINIGGLTAGATGRMVTLPLSAQDLARRYLSVRVTPVFINDNARCLTQDANKGYVRILPDSGLSYSDASRAAQSIRGFLTMLGAQVRVRAPSPIASVRDFLATLAVSSYLQAQGRTIVWVGLDAAADIVIGAPEAAGGIRLVPAHGPIPAYLAIAATGPQGLLLSPWSDLLASDAYDASRASGSTEPKGQVLPLSRFGVTAEPVPLASHAAWTLNLTPDDIRHQAPTHLHLNLVVPPSPRDNPLLLHVFNNATLRHVAALPEQGGPVSLDLDLVEAGVSASDSIRLELVRQTGVGACQSPLVGSYAQILPSSTLTTLPITTPPDTLDALARHFDADAPIYLPADALAHAATWLPVLSGVVNDLHFNPYNLSLHVDNAPPAAGRNFIWLRPEPPAGFTAPVMFDRGRLRIIESNGHVLLDSPPLPDIELAAVLAQGTARGLWIKPTAGDVPLRPLGFDTAPGNLVLLDAAGQVTSVDTRVMPVSHDVTPAVTYPEHQTWLDRLQNARLWVLGGGLFALTLIFLSIVDKIRPRRSDKTDV